MCLRLFEHWARRAGSLALRVAGSSSAINSPITPMTTRIVTSLRLSVLVFGAGDSPAVFGLSYGLLVIGANPIDCQNLFSSLTDVTSTGKSLKKEKSSTNGKYRRLSMPGASSSITTLI
jgi:hypothetical protein